MRRIQKVDLENRLAKPLVKRPDKVNVPRREETPLILSVVNSESSLSVIRQLILLLNKPEMMSMQSNLMTTRAIKK